MRQAQVIHQSVDWLVPGIAPENFLRPIQECDRIYLCPEDLGVGSVREIILRNDLSLLIQNFKLHRDLYIHYRNQNSEPTVKFVFILSGHQAGYALFDPTIGMQDFYVDIAQKQTKTVVVLFHASSFTKIFNAFVERLLPALSHLAREIVKRMNSQTSPHSLEKVLSMEQYIQFSALDQFRQCPITSSMQLNLEQILSCQGVKDRKCMENHSLELVWLYLESCLHRQSPSKNLAQEDLASIEAAEGILRQNLSHPPAIETLGRHVLLNRLKLNQGFHQLYNTTPYTYLRHCRMRKARYLLTNSELTIPSIIKSVGYHSHSSFTQAFRQQFGLTPKAFQLQMRACH